MEAMKEMSEKKQSLEETLAKIKEKNIYSAEFDFAKGTIELEAAWDKEKLEKLLHDANVVQKYRYFIWRNDEENKLTFWFAVPEYPYDFEPGKAETCMEIIALSKAAMFVMHEIERMLSDEAGDCDGADSTSHRQEIIDRRNLYWDKLPEMIETKAKSVANIVWNMVW